MSLLVLVAGLSIVTYLLQGHCTLDGGTHALSCSELCQIVLCFALRLGQAVGGYGVEAPTVAAAKRCRTVLLRVGRGLGVHIVLGVHTASRQER
jgi:hypothetical protein